MDDRDHHDTNVVSLRRKDRGSGRDQDQVASTIFAEQDEISTFSRGNLVPPRAPGDEPTQSSDPFFDEHLQHQGSTDEMVGRPQVGAEADEYFAQLVEQSASEMADQLRGREQSPAISMPGSASLTLDATGGGGQSWRIGLPKRARRGQPWRRVAGRSIFISVATGLLAAGALALIVLVLGKEPAAVPSSGGNPQLASILSVERNPFTLDLVGALRHSPVRAGSRHAPSHRNHRAAPRVHKSVRVDRLRRSDAPVSATGTSATTPAAQASVGQSTGASSTAPTTGAPATSSPSPAQSTGSSSTGQTAKSSNPPAFGPNGTLGPGHSSIG